MNGYVCFYKITRIEVQAATLYDAKVKACAALKVPRNKQHMVSVTLAEKDGITVEHTAT